MAKGKITKRVGEKVWANPKTGKNVYFVSIEIDNGDKGDKGEVWCNASGEMKEGEEIEYDVEKRDGKPDSIRIKKSAGAGYQKKAWVGEDNELKMITMSYSYAKDLCVAGKITDQQLHGTAESIATKMQALHQKLKATAPKPAEDAKV